MERAKFIAETQEFKVYTYRGTPWRPFMVDLDQQTLSARIRLFAEWFCGRRVYYIKMKDSGNWGGYCAVCNGRNPRYHFCDSRDIVFGHYMITEPYRGQKLSERMLKAVMDKAVGNYRYAYAYVKKENIISQKAILAFGAVQTSEMVITGFLRRIQLCENDGTYILFRYENKETAQP